MLYDLDKLLVVDVETDALWGYTKIHCIVASDLEGNEYVFEEPTKNPYVRKRFYELVRGRPVAGNNFLGFDLRALRDLLGTDLPITEADVLDTLVVSRLLNYKKVGGHSLENWGVSLGIKKEGVGIKDWSVYTPLMLERCKSDVKIGVFQVERMRRFLEDPDWEPSIRVEHQVAVMCSDMTRNGLPFDKAGAIVLLDMLRERLKPIEDALQHDFPPRPTLLKTITPVRTKKGTLSVQQFQWARTHEFSYDPSTRCCLLVSDKPDADPDLSVFDGEPFDLYHLVPFNAGSPLQVVTVLNEAGWKPTEKTKGHLDALKDLRRNRRQADPAVKERIKQYEVTGWKVSEENLKTLPDTAPESAKKLAQRLILTSRISDLEEWIALTQADGRIHGSYTSIGAWTHRLSHSRPNTANIPVAKRSKKDNEFETFTNDINDAMRALFVAPPGYRLIGTDADGIQMRIFAHLVGDERLINALVNGSKDVDPPTDIHSVHRRALGTVCKSRDAAKTFIYAFLLGAGVAKVAVILECSIKEAKAAVDAFLAFYPGLKFLKEKRIPDDAARGYFVGLDGRKVACDSEHLMLSGYLQNGEKVIMAYCGVWWEKRLREEGLPYWLLNWVHDEWQVLIPDDDVIAKRVTDIQLESFAYVTDLLNVLCPLAGTTSTHDGFIGGYTWKDTH